MAVEHDSDVSAFVKKLGIEASSFLEVVQAYNEHEEKETDAKVEQGLADFEDFNINADLRCQVDEICRLQSERVAAIASADPFDANFTVDTALPALTDRVEESQGGAQTSVQSVNQVENEENPESNEDVEHAQNEENEENEENKKDEDFGESQMDKVGEFIEASGSGLPSWFTDANYVVPEASEAPPTAASSCVRRWGKRFEGEAAEAEAEQVQSSHWPETSHHDHNSYNSYNSHNSHGQEPWEGWEGWQAREGSQGWTRSDGAGAEGAGWSDSDWQRDAQGDWRESRRSSWQSQSWWDSTDDWQSDRWRNNTWDSKDWGSAGWHSHSFSIEFRSSVDLVIFLSSNYMYMIDKIGIRRKLM